MPRNPELPEPPPTKREQIDVVILDYGDLMSQLGLVLTMSVIFIILGTPLVALGLVLGTAVALGFRRR